ncbi:transcriptional regulator, Nlp family [Tistlia consotensis]|uniref:Transcriptional regulator, Nlp family n=2 Tax=Tistlia TaxID=1321364 RepID=A0A1Y6CYE5_9PROT|nr:transcriptional regulator, Nlp family [Tistlia consotensis USBA 355]SNS38857.1 transcriptional regulator, Nlp family [Tistlia consotensis]
MADTPQGWHPEDIRAALRKRHGTIAAFARKIGYAQSSLSNVLAYGRYVPGPMRAIAEDLGAGLFSLWPHFHHPDGTPRQGRGATNVDKDSAAGRRRNVQRRRAA